MRSRCFRHTLQLCWMLFFFIYIFSPRTHPVEFAVVVAGVGVEGAQLHPAETHLVLGRVEEPADIGSGLQGEQWG